jgi:CHAT domain-containing protein
VKLRSVTVRQLAAVMYGLAIVVALGGAPATAQSAGRADEQAVLNEANSLRSEAAIYQMLGRFPEAEPLLLRAIDLVKTRLGPDHRELRTLSASLASLRQAQGRPDAPADPAASPAQAAAAMAAASDIQGLIDAANRARLGGRLGDAEQFYRQAQTIRTSDSSYRQSIFNGLARTAFDKAAWAQAAEHWQQGTDEIITALRGSARLSSQSLQFREGKLDLSNRSEEFVGLVKTMYQLAVTSPARRKEWASRAFERAQWVINPEAARAVAQMAVRAAPGGAELAALIRRKQDRTAEWQKLDELRQQSRQTRPEDAASRASYAAQLTAIDDELVALEIRLDASFPDYAATVTPLAADVASIQDLLTRNEVLVFVLGAPALGSLGEETFVWLISKYDVLWIRSELGPQRLSREVAALRCGVDYAAWREAGNGCDGLIGASYTAQDRTAGRALPFDTRRAYGIYQSLFSGAASFIGGKQLIFVPTGPLTQLPLQLLVTKPPDSADFRRTSWMALDFAITTMPTASSLISLRKQVRPSRARQKMAGFGNPLLDGQQSDPILGADAREKSRLARDKQACLPAGLRELAKPDNRGLASLAMQSGRLADSAQLRRQAPLPETADELCEVASRMNADPSTIRLGARATERAIKAMSASGDLADYRILYFATHGVLAGRLRGDSEPGLIMTPPEQPSEEDDGYLSASEIAGLKIDADWVILSACNTAAGGIDGNETLSGLARAFFYAQARSLLVSYWAVNSESSVRLLTDTFLVVTDNHVGKAEALHLAIVKMIREGRAYEAHPEYWAPFVLIGDSAN